VEAFGRHLGGADASAPLFLISSSPSVFSVVYLNRVNRDFALFRELGFSEFQAEFHAGLVELTVQITHQRIDQSAARALSHILPTPIDALCLTPMVFVPLSVRWITCGQSAFTMSHVFSASATGFQQIGSASRLVIRQNASARLHALSALSCIYISITYFVTHAACSIAKECTAFYISVHPRLRLRPEIRWASFLSHCCYEQQQLPSLLAMLKSRVSSFCQTA